MNPVAMTIISPRKDIGLARDQTSDLLLSSSERYRLSYGAWLFQLGPVETFVVW